MSDLPSEIATEARKRFAGLTLPVRLIVGSVAILAVVAMLIVLANSKIDWFGLSKKHAAEAEQKAATATDNATARSIEATGERRSAQRVDVVIHQQQDSAAALGAAVQEARSAPDANEPIDPARLARIRGFDERLCDGSSLVGCPAPPANAGPSAGPLPSGQTTR